MFYLKIDRSKRHFFLNLTKKVVVGNFLLWVIFLPTRPRTAMSTTIAEEIENFLSESDITEISNLVSVWPQDFGIYQVDEAVVPQTEPVEPVEPVEPTEEPEPESESELESEPEEFDNRSLLSPTFSEQLENIDCEEENAEEDAVSDSASLKRQHSSSEEEDDFEGASSPKRADFGEPMYNGTYYKGERADASTIIGALKEIDHLEERLARAVRDADKLHHETNDLKEMLGDVRAERDALRDQRDTQRKEYEELNDLHLKAQTDLRKALAEVEALKLTNERLR